METSVPTRVSYTKDDVAMELEKTVISDGIWVMCVIDDVRQFAKENKAAEKQDERYGSGPGQDLSFLFSLAVLDPETGTDRVPNAKMSHFVGTPIRDPENADTHRPPKWNRDAWRNFIQAVNPEACPREPMRSNGRLMYQGEEIAEDEKGGVLQELADTRMSLVVEHWNSAGANLKNETFFAKTKHSGEYINVTALCAELPKGVSLAAKEDLFTVIGGEEGATKPAKKKKKAAKKGRR